MRFRIGCFSIRRSALLALFALEDYQQKLDRYRNGKPIVRISGPIAKNTVPIEAINQDFVNNPKQRIGLIDRFKSSGGLTSVFYPGARRTPRQTKAKPSRVRTRKAVRVKMANGATHLRIQNVVADVKSVAVTPVQSSVRGSNGGGKSALIRDVFGGSFPAWRVTRHARKARLGLGAIAGAGGIGYLINRQLNK